MILIESIVGNANDEPWRMRLEAASVDYLDLDQWQAQKNRLRKTTAGGTELALSLDRSQHLRDGDILLWEEPGQAIVARIALRDVMVIGLARAFASAPDQLAQTCFELGHAIGNQHWPAVFKDREIYIPLIIDQKVMASVMKTHDFKDVDFRFEPGRNVIPHLAPHEARRVFGGAGATPHSHLGQPVLRHDNLEIRHPSRP